MFVEKIMNNVKSMPLRLVLNDLRFHYKKVEIKETKMTM